MTLARYLLGVILAAIALVPVCGGCWALRKRLLPRWTGPPAHLAGIVLLLGVVIGVSEVLGAIGLFRLAPIVVAFAGAGVALWLTASRSSTTPDTHVADHGAASPSHVAAPDPPGRIAGSEAEISVAPIAAGIGAVLLADPVRATTEDEAKAVVGPTRRSDVGQESPNRLGRGALVVALIATAVVAAEWGTRTVAVLHHGMDTVDTLWYHLPTAARFVQDGSITKLHFLAAPDPVVVFFPANSALLHGLGMAFLDNDLLSPLLNLGFLGVALLAGWCIGRPFGVAPVTLTGTAVLLATPGFIATQPGGAYNDVVGVALLLTSAALLVNAYRDGHLFGIAAVVVAAIAAGLALGTKFTFIAPVAALTLGVIALTPRGARVRQGGAWVLVVVLAGGFWYIRNFLSAGNPLPGFSFGPLDLPSPPNDTASSTVSRFLFDGSAWKNFFVPGLGKAYGPAWWALVALAATGLVLAVLAGPRLIVRMLGLVGIAAFVAYLFSPQFLTLFGVPYYFVFNLRYVSPALILGLVLLPTVPLVARNRRAWWILGAFAFVLIAIQLDPTVWPTDFFGLRFGFPIEGIDSLAGAVVGLLVLGIGAVTFVARRRADRWPLPKTATLTIALLVSVIAGFWLQQTYMRNRYAVGHGAVHVAARPLPELYKWARDIHDERIGIAGGYTILQYPLYGQDQSNHVQYVGTRGPYGEFNPIRDCASWRRALNTGQYSYVVTSAGANLKGPPLEAVWTSSDPAAAFIGKKGPDVSVFRITGRLEPGACDRLPADQRTMPAKPGIGQTQTDRDGRRSTRSAHVPLH